MSNAIGRVPLALDSIGFATRGVVPYYTLFQVIGNSATVLDSQDGKVFYTVGDLLHPHSLGVGSCMVAPGAFANLLLAENSGTGALGDRFTSTRRAR